MPEIETDATFGTKFIAEAKRIEKNLRRCNTAASIVRHDPSWRAIRDHPATRPKVNELIAKFDAIQKQISALHHHLFNEVVPNLTKLIADSTAVNKVISALEAELIQLQATDPDGKLLVLPENLSEMLLVELADVILERREVLRLPKRQTTEYLRAVNVLRNYAYGTTATVRDLFMDWPGFCRSPNAGRHTLKFIQNTLTELGAKNLPDIPPL